MVDDNVSLGSINDDCLASLVVDKQSGSNTTEKSSDLLLTDIIEELGEYNRARQLFKTQPTQPSSPNENDVKALYFEDLVKIQEQLRDEESTNNEEFASSSSSSIHQHFHENIYNSNIDETSKLCVQENQTRPEFDQVMKYANEINSTLSSSSFHPDIEKVNTTGASAVGACAMETEYATSDSDGDKNEKEIRKMKNNEASKVHRAKKKQKYQNLFQRESELKVKNVGLKLQVETMEKELAYLRELLLVKVAVSSKPPQSFDTP